MKSEEYYAGLEGKEISVVTYDGEVYRGIVDGCDPSIGITVTKVANRDQPLFCLNGEGAPNGPRANKSNDAPPLDKHVEILKWLHEELCRQIETGTVFIAPLQDKYLEFIRKYDKLCVARPVTRDDCSFSQ